MRLPKIFTNMLTWTNSIHFLQVFYVIQTQRYPSHVEPSTDFSNSFKHNDVSSHVGALTIQIHSNTTISLNILAPTLLARLLQYPKVNSLASSPGRNNFRSRSEHARLLTISEYDVLVTSIVGMGDAEKLHREVFNRRGGLPRSRCREAPRRG